MIITEAYATAYPCGARSAHQLGMSDDSFIAGLSRPTERVKSHDVAVAVQLVRHGKMSRLDIEGVVDDFAAATTRARDGSINC